MDLDTTRNKGSYERILKSFSAGEADILIGTQMIVKGHDFPKVTLVGVLLADLSLHESDYRASEKTFQLLTQAVGRAGRNGQRSDAVIQTYQPDHYSILLAAKQDYESFYQAEICYRQMLGYPPVSQMMVVLLLSKDESLLEKEAEKLRIFLDREKSEQIRILGPSPAAVSKIQDVYRQVIYFRQKSLEQMIELRKKIEVYAGKQLSKEVWMEFELNPLQWH